MRRRAYCDLGMAQVVRNSSKWFKVVQSNVLLLVLFCLFTACEPERNCYREMNTAVQISFSADSVTVAGDTVHYTQWDSIMVVGVGSDVSLQGENIKTIGLELQPDTTLTSYLMIYHDQIDTLYIQHTPRQQFVSMACGCVVYHTISAAWSSDPRVDSVTIVNAAVETVAQENICIYLHE